MSSEEPTEIVIEEAQAGERLDRALAHRLPDVSRARIRKAIDEGGVTVNGEPPARGSRTKVAGGDRILFVPPEVQTWDLVAEDLPLAILFEDEHLVVVNKAAGMVVHPAHGHASGTLVNAILHHVQTLDPAAGDFRPGIVHRLDKDTTGAMVVAKHPLAHERLADAFKARRVDKIYLAVTKGVPRPTKGTISTSYGRHPTDRKRFSSKVTSGKPAVTHYEVIESFTGAALVRVELETGRTHQIRVHFADRGHPLVGDRVYGRRRSKGSEGASDPIASFARPALHAHRLAFAHPMRDERVEVEAPLPADLVELTERLRSARPASH